MIYLRVFKSYLLDQKCEVLVECAQKFPHLSKCIVAKKNWDLMLSPWDSPFYRESNSVTPGWNLLHVFVGYQTNFPWFYKILKETRPCIKTSSLIQFSFINLPIRCILNLAAILRRNVLQVSLRCRSKFESSWDCHQFYRDFNANKLQLHVKFRSCIIFSVRFDKISFILEKTASLILLLELLNQLAGFQRNIMEIWDKSDTKFFKVWFTKLFKLL